MKRSVILLLHLGYWSIYLLLLSIVFALTQLPVGKGLAFPTEMFTSPVGVTSIFPNVITFYLFYFWLFPGFLARRKFVYFVLSGLLASILCAILCSALIGILYGFDQALFSSSMELIGLLIPLSIIALIHGTIAMVIRGFITWYKEIKLKEELQEKNREMESALVKSKLDPHFLFNTINNIDVLIEEDPAKASTYLNKLSEILRFVLHETYSDRVLLKKELEYIEKYIDLQKIRTSNKKYVTFEVAGNPGDVKIAPMIFIPFIENAFKHAGNKKIENAIRIRFDIAPDRIGFECVNSMSKNSSPAEIGGLGNELIRSRLEMLYPDSYSLETTTKDGSYRVNLTLTGK